MAHAQVGTILAVENDALMDGGAFASFGPITPYYLMQLLGGPIKIGAYRARARRVYTNKPPQGPKRGHGTPQPRFAFEMMLNEAANTLSIDPVLIRRMNAIKAGDTTINGFVVPSSGIKDCLDAVERVSKFQTLHGKLTNGWGIGIATGMYISGTGHPIDASEQKQSEVELERLPDGTFIIRSCANDIGQGLGETVRRIAARRLNVDPKFVAIMLGDTALGPIDLGAYFSRGTFMLGTAVRRAADGMLTRMNNGEEHPKVMGSFTTIHVTGGDYPGSTIGASPTYSMTAVVALVKVVKQTGRVQTHRLWIAHDCGVAVNPIAVEGQIEGSGSMGDSEARFEEILYDERKGLQLGTNLLGHPIATSMDGPEIESIIISSVDPMSPHGAKEAGEGPLLPVASAIGSAIFNAVGVWPCEVPFKSDRILELIRSRMEVGDASSS